MSRIAETFAALEKRGRKALIAYLMAGDPDRAASVPLMHALVEGGADIIELGVPFSDPMAEGPVIQRAAERGLSSHTGLADVLAMVEEFRRADPRTPVVLMGYANPIERFGQPAFCEAAQRAGTDGVLVVDYPPEESIEFAALLRQHGMDPIFLLSPTSSDARIALVAEAAGGYVYYVSLRGVTGAAHIDLNEIAEKVPHIKARTALPVGVGFGIRDPETARAVSKLADAVVVGSRIVTEIETSPRELLIGNVKALVASLRNAMDKETHR